MKNETIKTIANYKIELVDTGTFCNVRIYEPAATMFTSGGSFDNVETAEKWATEKVIKAIKQRLEELRKELRAERISTGELLELQSLSKYIDKGDVELLEAAGVPEFDEDETTDLFATPELIPDNVRAVFDKYDNGDELSYEEIFKLHTEVEELGYTFDYYLDAVPYNLRKL